MKGSFVLGIALTCGLAVLAGSATAQTAYVGSDACKMCHEDRYNGHGASGHPHKLRAAPDSSTWPLPLPKGYDWDDISYVIGGYKWKARYMDLDGFIITSDGSGPGNNQYNLATGMWSDYHAGEVDKPYNCGGCHTTGYSPEGSQGDLPGIVGTWEFEGIQCEECHGPGAAHAASQAREDIVRDTSAAACGECHVRSDPQTIPASGGFIRHHEQYNELLASPHATLNCVDCHDAHKKSDFSIHTDCITCHPTMAEQRSFKKTGRKHLARGVDCVDCHMPYAAKSAVAFNQYKGDVRSHLAKITTDRDATMFNEEGTLANNALTGEYACLGCHVEVTERFEAKGRPEKAALWAARKAKKIHR